MNNTASAMLERFETYLGTCAYSTKHGSVITIHTSSKGDTQAFAFFNANPGDKLLVSCQRSYTNENRLPLVSVDSVLEFAEISKRLA